MGSRITIPCHTSDGGCHCHFYQCGSYNDNLSERFVCGTHRASLHLNRNSHCKSKKLYLYMMRCIWHFSKGSYVLLLRVITASKHKGPGSRNDLFLLFVCWSLRRDGNQLIALMKINCFLPRSRNDRGEQ